MGYDNQKSTILVVVMLCTTIASSAFAAESTLRKIYIDSGQIRAEQARFDAMDSDELKTVLMEEYGATEAEAEQLILLSRMSNENAISRAGGFPSNPSIGDTCTIEYTLYIDDTATASSIAADLLLSSPYINLAAALYIATIVLSAGSAILGSTITIRVNYTYGYTNDGVLGWTPGYVEVL